MTTVHNSQDDCCSRPPEAYRKGSGPNALFVLPAAAATGLAGLSCLACVPFIGAALATSSFALVLDSHLIWLQYGLIAISAIFTYAYFRRMHFSAARWLIATLLYLTLGIKVGMGLSTWISSIAFACLALVHLLPSKNRATAANIRLLYFPGCPTYPILRDALREGGISKIQEVNIDNLPEGHPLRAYSSPTILQGDGLIFGAQTTNASKSCSFFSQAEINEVVRRLKAESKPR